MLPQKKVRSYPTLSLGDAKVPLSPESVQEESTCNPSGSIRDKIRGREILG